MRYIWKGKPLRELFSRDSFRTREIEETHLLPLVSFAHTNRLPAASVQFYCRK